MTTVFPTNNLPTAAQPWAREVQKQLSNVIASDNSERINNTARDNQINSSVIALSGVVADVKVAVEDAADAADKANDAIAGLTSLGSVDSAYSINAGNISGGTITGITIRTASSGQRIVLSGTTLDFYSPNGTFSGRLVQEGGDAVPSVNMVSADSSNYIQVWDSGARMFADGSTVVAFSGQILLSSALVSTSSAFTSAGTFRASSTVFMPSISTAVTNTANMRRNQGGEGEVVVTNQSSIRFKKDVTDIALIEDLDPKKLLQLPARAFKYKDDYPISPDDSRYQKFIPGFIAEEVEEFYPMGADYEDIKNGVVESWNERMIVPGMLALIQELYTRIETLENGAS